MSTPRNSTTPGDDNRGRAQKKITQPKGSVPDRTVLFGLDARVDVLDAQERREAALIAELYDLGYRVAVQCRSCGSWLAHPQSVARHQGPVCASREEVQR